MLKHIFTVLSGGAAGQLLLILFSPILTRLFSPELLGQVGVLVAIAAVVSILITMRFEMALVIDGNGYSLKEKFSNITNFASLSFLSISLIGLVLTLGIQSIDLGLTYNWSLFDLVSVLALALSGSLFSLYNYLAVKLGGFKSIALASFLGPVCYIIVLSLGLLIGPSLCLLVIGNFCNSAIKVLILLTKNKGFNATFKFSLNGEFISRYKELIKYRAPNDILSSASQNVPVFILGGLFGATPVGFYWLCVRVIRLPATILGDSIKKVLLNRVSQLEGDLVKSIALSRKATLILFLITLLPSLVVIYWGNNIFSLVFGSDWATAGEYAQIIIIWVMFLICNIPTMVLITCFNLQKLLLTYETIGLSARVIAMLGSAIFYEDPIVSLKAFVAVAVISNISLIFHVGFILKQKINRVM